MYSLLARVSKEQRSIIHVTVSEAGRHLLTIELKKYFTRKAFFEGSLSHTGWSHGHSINETGNQSRALTNRNDSDG